MDEHANKMIMTKPQRRRRRLLVLCSGLFVGVLLAAFVGYTLLFSSTPPAPQRHVVAAPVLKPVLGDVHDPEDTDPDITIQQSLIPSFQFKTGGYTLSGTVTDARTSRPVYGAVVWINLPVQMGQPTSAALHAVTDADGRYQFLHLAQGVYTLVASRYNAMGDGRDYAERVFPSVMLQRDRSGLVLPLTAIPTPGRHVLHSGQAKNLLLIDVRGFYASSLLDDPLLANQTRNLRTFLQRAQVARSLWFPYGWRPLDQYALLTGTYPVWDTYDPWPHVVPWGLPDNIDTSFWFTGGRNDHLFGQESIFDVAKSYGMQTGVIAGNDYVMSDATTRNLDMLQRSSNFSASHWLKQMEDAVISNQRQANGFLLYSELAPLPAADGSSSPETVGDEYQQALLLADQTFGQFFSWLEQQGLLQNTLVALTTSQAQANHTYADNFYGMGHTGQGTSKQTLLALLGPGVCAGAASEMDYSAFIIAPVLMQRLGLPAPAEARLSSPLPEGGC